MLFSLAPMLNAFMLLMIVFFIYAVMGVFMFQRIVRGSVIDGNFMNFRNFGNAILMLFRISTGEDWDAVMYDTMD